MTVSNEFIHIPSNFISRNIHPRKMNAYDHRKLVMNIYSNFIHNIPKKETIQYKTGKKIYGVSVGKLTTKI